MPKLGAPILGVRRRFGYPASRFGPLERGGNANLALFGSDLTNAVWSQDAPSGARTTGGVTLTGVGNDYLYQLITGVPGATYRYSAILSAPVKTLIRFGDIVNTTLQNVVLTPTPTLFAYTGVAGGAPVYVGIDNRIAQGGDGIAGVVNMTDVRVVRQ